MCSCIFGWMPEAVGLTEFVILLFKAQSAANQSSHINNVNGHRKQNTFMKVSLKMIKITC